MDVEITVKNYRCFGPKGATLRVRDGFTALVGVNNSGKSSLLRVIYEMRNLFAHMGNSGVQSLIGQRKDAWLQPILLPGERISRAGSGKPPQISIKVNDGPNGPLESSLGAITAHFVLEADGNTTAYYSHDGQRLEELVAARVEPAPLVSVSQSLANSLYIGPFRNAISTTAGQQYFDLQIGTGFIENFADYKSGFNPEQGESVVKLTKEIRRIFGYESLEINPSSDRKMLQIIINDQVLRLSELGAGLSHFIIVLINALIKRPSLILIDEPELNLHASLQLDFLAALTKNTTEGVVFATHSLGLARTSAEHIYVLDGSSGQSIVREYEHHENLASIAAQLGFDGRPELGFKKVLLVEGKSDVRAVMQLLRLYGKEHKVALVPMGGGELLHKGSDVELRELMRLGEVHYLIDSERTAAGGEPRAGHRAFQEVCSTLGLPGHMLERRAIENYFPESAITRALGSGHSALGDYGKFEAGSGWSKSSNWKIAAELTAADLEGTDLGGYLAEL